MKPPRRTLFLEFFRRRCGVVSLPMLLVALGPLVCLPQGYALPQGGQVVAGQVTTTINGTQLTLDQASRNAIMNWQSFNIAPNEVVRILQSGPDAAMLARVTGGNPSELLGRLQADGKLFLINPRGILVGQGAVIDTAAFLASTLDVADADFLKQGALTFKGDSTAGVINLGKITAREGNVLLLAHTVKNAGEISATNGTAGLGAGTEVYLASPDAPTFVIKTNLAATAEKTGLDNSGVIASAQAQLEAAGGSIYDLAVNQSGTIRASGVEHRPDGRIVLTAAGGNVLVTGSAVARNADGSGGEILVGGDYQGRNAAVANAAKVQVGATASLDASAASATGDGGRVIVWADDATRFLGSLQAKAGAAGGDGGFAEVSGKRSLGFHGTVDLAAPAGNRGTLLLDPDNITIVAGTTGLPSGLMTGAPFSWSESEDPGSQNLGADDLVGLLANNRVHLAAADTITVNAPVVVAAGGTPGIGLSFSASTIAINQTVSLANVTGGELSFFHGGSAGGTSLTTAAGATIAAPKIRVGGFPITALNGPVSTAKLIYDGFGTQTSFTATNPANAITHFVLNTDQADPEAVDFTGNVALHSGTALDVSAMIGAANNVTFSSAGNLTMRNDDTDVSTITASGTIKLASTGGVLINQAGAGLLNGAGRRLLYTSATTGAFTLGGLTGYTQFDGVSYPNDPNSAVTLVLYNSAGGGPVLTLTITANDFIKLYGQPDPTFTASYAGGTAADLTTLPSFSIQQGAHVNVGTYTIVPSGAASGTHTLQYVNGTLRIDPATLTYIANPASRLYGDANPAFSGSVTGFVAGDTLASATTGTLSFSSPATVASNAGSHAINGGGLTANFGNYVFQDAVANFSALSVNRAPLTVTYADATRVYGAADPAFSATASGFRNGDTFAVLANWEGATPAASGASVGSYPIGSNPSANNYAITVVLGTLRITPAPLTLRGTDATVIYGDPLPALGYTVSGLLGTDTAAVLSGVSIGTAFFNPTPPGTYTLPFASTGTAQNYAVTQVVPGTLTISRRRIPLAVDSVTTYAGIVPPLSANSAAPVVGGPQFTLGIEVREQVPLPGGGFDTRPITLTKQTAPGVYRLVPYVIPAGGTSMAQLEQAYDFAIFDAALTLNALPVGTILLDQLPPPTDSTLIINNGSPLDFSFTKVKFDLPPVNGVKVAYDSGPGGWVPPELMPAALNNVGGFEKDTFVIYGVEPMLTPEQQALCLQLNWDRGLRGNAELYEKNPDARTALAALLTTELLFSVDVAEARGKEYSPPAALVPLTNRISILLAEVRSERLEAVLKEMDSGNDYSMAGLYTVQKSELQVEAARLSDLIRNPTNGGLTNLKTDSAAREELFAAMVKMVNETYSHRPAGF